jgi:hypothetical protein
MRVPKSYLIIFSIVAVLKLHAQEENAPGTSIGFLGGVVSYQGDLQPNSFSFQETKSLFGVFVRQPLLQRLSLKAGFNTGSLYATDKNNRDYLKIRNLCFYTKINEAFLTLDYELLSITQRHFTPFAYAGFAYFHFNPYTYDTASIKVYLQPLGTEGQGLSRYPDRKPYQLSQLALAFGGGFRFLISDALLVSLEVGQRKTFTDYLDDVSKSYADEDALLAGRGPKAVELAFRSDELPGGGAYPHEGEQRGTPINKDWYYMASLSVEINLRAFTHMGGGKYFGKRDVYNMRCPKVRL